MGRRINPAKRLKIVAKPADVRRFLDHLTVELVPTVIRLGPCWIWDRCSDVAGYGQFKFSGKAIWAHRFAYALFRGTIPDGLQIDHKCHNPSCVNPLPPAPAVVVGERGRQPAAACGGVGGGTVLIFTDRARDVPAPKPPPRFLSEPGGL